VIKTQTEIGHDMRNFSEGRPVPGSDPAAAAALIGAPFSGGRPPPKNAAATDVESML